MSIPDDYEYIERLVDRHEMGDCPFGCDLCAIEDTLCCDTDFEAMEAVLDAVEAAKEDL